MRLLRPLAASACLAFGAACGGGDLGLPDDNLPAGITVVAGDDQSGDVGTELDDPLVVEVADAQGAPLSDIAVAFKPGAGAEGGSATPDTAVTDSLGRASTRWTLGGATGQQELVAQVVDRNLTVNFSAQASGSSVLHLELVSGDGQSGPTGEQLPEPLVVRLVDEAGDGVQGRAVTWVVATGDGSADPESSDTDGDGFASTAWTLGPLAGGNTLNAVVSGVGVVTFTATGSGGGPAPADHLVFQVQPIDTREDQEIVPAVEVALVDQLGNIVPQSGVEIELDLLRQDGDERNNRLDGERRQLTQDGVAVFPGLSVRRDDVGYRFRARVPGNDDLGTVESESFDVEP